MMIVASRRLASSRQQQQLRQLYQAASFPTTVIRRRGPQPPPLRLYTTARQPLRLYTTITRQQHGRHRRRLVRVFASDSKYATSRWWSRLRELVRKVVDSYKESWAILIKTPRLSAFQHAGAVILLYSYAETDVLLLRLWAVLGLVSYGLVPNSIRGNAILATWSTIFVTINAWRLWELSVQSLPVTLNEDEQEVYSEAGWHRYVTPQCFKRLVAKAQWEDLAAGHVLKVEGEVSRRLYVVRDGEILLTAHNRAVESATKKTLVGVPDLVGSLSSDTDTASDSRLSATVGSKGARLLGWDHTALKAAIAEEADPNVEMQIVKFFSDQLMRKVLQRDHSAAVDRYQAMLGYALRCDDDRYVSADDKAALYAFRASNGVTSEEHAALLAQQGWSLDDYRLGVKSDAEMTRAALANLSRRFKLKTTTAATTATTPAAATTTKHMPKPLHAPTTTLPVSKEPLLEDIPAPPPSDRSVKAKRSIVQAVVKAAAEAKSPPATPPLKKKQKKKRHWLSRVMPQQKEEAPLKRSQSLRPRSLEPALQPHATVHATVRRRNEASQQREEDLALLAREIALSARRSRVEKKKRQSSYYFFSKKPQEAESESEPEPESPVKTPTIPAVRSRPTLSSIFEPLHEEHEQEGEKPSSRRHLFPALRVVVDANDAEAGSPIKLLSEPQKVIQAAVADRIGSPLSRSISLPRRERGPPQNTFLRPPTPLQAAGTKKPALKRSKSV